jgi:cellulose synthase/poly-beta-1,6-N-acetylglucosamine synthase-like glycosyltransferase
MAVLLNILWVLYYAVNIMVGWYFIQPVLLSIGYSLLPPKKRRDTTAPADGETSFAAIVTAHRDTRFIPPLVDSFCKQTYQHFIVYVVADDCDVSDLHCSDPRIRILRPEIPFHAKTKSIAYAVAQFEQAHDALIIFDSDNLVHPNYLSNLNRYFKDGFRAVQTHMLSKNIGNTYAKLDSVGHIYNTFTEREAKMRLGISSAILGLGIAIDLQLYREIFYNNALGGFDKKLQIQLVQKVKQIAFAADCIVYDEKVEDGDTLEKQRTRWIFTYFNYFKESFSLFIHGIKRMRISEVMMGLMMLRPPLFILFFIGLLLMVSGLFLKPFIAVVWAMLFLLFILNFVWVIAAHSRQKGMVQSLIHLPRMVIRQVKSLLKIKSASKDFLKTEHKRVMYIDDLLKDESA